MESSWSLKSNFRRILFFLQITAPFSMYLESKSCQEYLWSTLSDQMKAKEAPVLLPWPCDILTWCYPPSPPVPHLPLLPMLYWILLMLHKSMLSISLPWLRNVGMITYSFPLEDCFCTLENMWCIVSEAGDDSNVINSHESTTSKGQIHLQSRQHQIRNWPKAKTVYTLWNFKIVPAS